MAKKQKTAIMVVSESPDTYNKLKGLLVELMEMGEFVSPERSGEFENGGGYWTFTYYGIKETKLRMDILARRVCGFSPEKDVVYPKEKTTLIFPGGIAMLVKNIAQGEAPVLG